jgi:hypothetical protein
MGESRTTPTVRGDRPSARTAATKGAVPAGPTCAAACTPGNVVQHRISGIGRVQTVQWRLHHLIG